MHAMQTRRCYLGGSDCTIVIDHNPLVYLKTQQTLSRRQTRWLEFLEQNFVYRWVYRLGKINMADPLNRNPLNWGDQTALMAPRSTPSNSVLQMVALGEVISESETTIPRNTRNSSMIQSYIKLSLPGMLLIFGSQTRTI
jgi:hypothetical protein